MPDFAVVPQPTSLGNTCALCNTHKHERGFVNLNRDELGYGRLHACASCADQIGRAVGGIDPQQVGILHAAVDELAATAERLQGELAAEKVDKVVPLAEIVDYFEERARRRPDEPKPATEPETKPETTQPKASA